MRPDQSYWYDLKTFDHNICDFAIAVKEKSFQKLQLPVEEATENNALKEREHNPLSFNWMSH